MVPTRTFWRPIYFDEYNEPNLLHPDFARKVRDFSDFKLPDELQEALKGHPEEEPVRYREGVLVSQLRPYEPRPAKDFLRFDRLFSKGEFIEQKELDRIKQTISEKLAKEVKDHGQRFKQ